MLSVGSSKPMTSTYLYKYMKVTLLHRITGEFYNSTKSISNLVPKCRYISLICDTSVTTQNLAFLSYWYRKKRLQMHF